MDEKTIKEVIEGVKNYPIFESDFKGIGKIELREASFYQIFPLLKSDESGRVISKGSLWIHVKVHVYWDFWHYSSDVWAWITDSRDNGNLVNVDKITAFISHDNHYGSGKDEQHNTYGAHAFVRNNGIAVPSSCVYGRGCVEHTGYYQTCTDNAKACP